MMVELFVLMFTAIALTEGLGWAVNNPVPRVLVGN